MTEATAVTPVRRAFVRPEPSVATPVPDSTVRLAGEDRSISSRECRAIRAARALNPRARAVHAPATMQSTLAPPVDRLHASASVSRRVSTETARARHDARVAEAIAAHEEPGVFQRAVRWFSRTSLYRWVAGTILAHATFRVGGYPRLPMESYEQIRTALREGQARGPAIYAWVQSDTLSLAATLTNLLADGEYTHAGIIDPDDPDRVYHMKGYGLVHDHILDVMKQTDRFALVRYEVTPAEYEEFRRRLQELKDRRVQYDYPMEMEDLEGGEVDDIYCSELIWHLGKGLVDDERFWPERIGGRHVFHPDNVRNSGELLFELKA